MDRAEKKYLADMLSAINNIEVHLQGKKEYDLFYRNITVQSAIKYEFSVIGEAMYELLKLKPDFKLSHSVKIIGFRNKMVHEYDAIDNVQVWNVVINYLPLLKNEVEGLLK